MPELPASVRVALWATHAWKGTMSIHDAAGRALPDVDHTQGLLDQLTVWRDLGEAAVLVALPSPGATSGLPGCGPVARADAVDAGEALYVAALGGLLVPHHSTYGSEGARAHRIDWMGHDADPVPAHRLEALEPSQLERHLRRRMLAAIDELETVGATPWADDVARDVAEERLGTDWALPPGLGDRARKVIVLAGSLSVATSVGMGTSGALTSAEDSRRAAVLRSLHRDCERTLADATNAACAEMAGWVPAR